MQCLTWNLRRPSNAILDSGLSKITLRNLVDIMIFTSIFNQVENNIDVHFNISILLKVLEYHSSISKLSPLCKCDESIREEWDSEEQEEKSNFIRLVGINELYILAEG